MMWWDTHCHLTDGRLSDTTGVLTNAQRSGVHSIIIPSTDLEDANKAAKLAQKHKLFFAAGVHPHEASHPLSSEMSEAFNGLLQQERCVAVGEVGLDYHYELAEKETQRNVFIVMIELAINHQLPVILHTRDAERDVFELISTYPSLQGVCHSYTGDVVLIGKFLDKGFFVSFNGMLTFKGSDNIRELARFVPLDRILLETDAPYLAPTPHRGKINEPAFIPVIANALAEIKGLPLDAIAKQTSENAATLFSRVA